MSLEENRFQEKKHKAKARRVLKDIYHNRELADDVKRVGKQAAVHSRGCSCPLCCHNRHNCWGKGKDRLTIQELRSNLDLKEMDYDATFYRTTEH